MNKKLFVLGAALIGLTFASCKKDWACTCNYDFQGQRTAIATAIPDKSRGDAAEDCDKIENNLLNTSSQTGFTNVECELGD